MQCYIMYSTVEAQVLSALDHYLPCKCPAVTTLQHWNVYCSLLHSSAQGESTFIDMGAPGLTLQASSCRRQ